MDDQAILALYQARDEAAIAETQHAYANYLYAIAIRILDSREDAEEIVNDTYLKLWNTIPPSTPSHLSAYAGTVCRQLSLNRYRDTHTKKRGGGLPPLLLDELNGCLSPTHDTLVDEIWLCDALNRFLGGLSKQARIVFMRRYWYFCSIEEIATSCSMSKSGVKMQLLRTRNALRDYLRKEGMDL